MLKDKYIVLGITGSIAAYKGADVASKLVQAGASVDVVMTASAMEFITPLTFRSLTGRPVVTDFFDPDSTEAVQHITLAQRTHAVLIAPATANTIAKLAHGIADDALSCIVLATQAPVLIAPAMNNNMWENAITQENVSRLKERGFTFIGPEYGRLASGAMGAGRFSDTAKIVDSVRWVLGRGGDLAGVRIVVSAGGTQEPFDPVRHIGNRSSGKQGYAVAEAARDRGASVTLVTAPTALEDPVGVKMVKVHTAREMREAVGKAVEGCNVLVMTAAVADYRPAVTAEQKIKKGDEDTLTIELVKNPDILAEVDGPFIKVGFAAESEDLVVNAQQKLNKKNLAMVAANDITAPDAGFAVDTNRIILIHRSGEIEHLPLMSKYEVGHALLDRVAELLVV